MDCKKNVSKKANLIVLTLFVLHIDVLIDWIGQRSLSFPVSYTIVIQVKLYGQRPLSLRLVAKT